MVPTHAVIPLDIRHFFWQLRVYRSDFSSFLETVAGDLSFGWLISAKHSWSDIPLCFHCFTRETRTWKFFSESHVPAASPSVSVILLFYNKRAQTSPTSWLMLWYPSPESKLLLD